jgi:hypothetical protein
MMKNVTFQNSATRPCKKARASSLSSLTDCGAASAIGGTIDQCFGYITRNSAQPWRVTKTMGVPLRREPGRRSPQAAALESESARRGKSARSHVSASMSKGMGERSRRSGPAGESPLTDARRRELELDVHIVDVGHVLRETNRANARYAR